MARRKQPVQPIEHERLVLCFSCCGSGDETPPGPVKKKCQRCEGTGYEK